MVIDVNRSNIKVRINDRTATLPGELFFPSNGKLGFALFRNMAKFWDAPNGTDPITDAEWSEIVADIQANFALGGHILGIE